MAIKVVFPIGTSSISVGGLFQWDYGQVLEIESADIGSEIVEVHFACPSMTEAIVRPCTFTNGVGTVTIPDQCLEQTNAITAWIFEVEGAQGHTTKTITLPLIARKRPSKIRDVSPEYVDKYAEALTEINKAVDALEKGEINAANATLAETAKYAETAGNAKSANHAATSTNASAASYASTANKAGVVALSEAASCFIDENGAGTLGGLDANALYLITLWKADFNEYYTGFCFIDSDGCGNTGFFIDLAPVTLYIANGTTVSVLYTADSSSPATNQRIKVSFYKIGAIF